jgi:hypothetical protein
VISIRYSSELQPGLHGRVERHGRRTFVYLLPGLTPEQRRAALRRMRQQGRMGISPRLPVVQLAAALVADRVSTAFGQAGAIVRVHPAGSTLPVMVVSVAIASFLVLSALSVHIVHLPAQAAGGSAVVASAPAGRAGQPLPSPGGGEPAGPVSAASGTSGGTSPGTVRSSAPGGIAPTPSGASGTNPVTGPGPGQSASPAPTQPSPGGSALSSTAATTPPSQSPTPAVTPTTAPSTSGPSPAATPSPTASAPPKSGRTDVCVGIGALGICLGL